MAMGAPGRRGGLERPRPVTRRNPRSAGLRLEWVVGAPPGARLPQNAKPGNAGRGAGLHAGLPAGRAESLRGNSRLAAAPRRSPSGGQLPGLTHPALPLVVLDPKHHTIVTAALAGPVDHIYARVECEPRHLGGPESVSTPLAAAAAGHVHRLAPVAPPPGQRMRAEPLVQLVALKELLDVRSHRAPPRDRWECVSLRSNSLDSRRAR